MTTKAAIRGSIPTITTTEASLSTSTAASPSTTTTTSTSTRFDDTNNSVHHDESKSKTTAAQNNPKPASPVDSSHKESTKNDQADSAHEEQTLSNKRHTSPTVIRDEEPLSSCQKDDNVNNNSKNHQADDNDDNKMPSAVPDPTRERTTLARVSATSATPPPTTTRTTTTASSSPQEPPVSQGPPPKESEAPSPSPTPTEPALVATTTGSLPLKKRRRSSEAPSSTSSASSSSTKQPLLLLWKSSSSTTTTNNNTADSTPSTNGEGSRGGEGPASLGNSSSTNNNKKKATPRRSIAVQQDSSSSGGNIKNNQKHYQPATTTAPPKSNVAGAAADPPPRPSFTASCFEIKKKPNHERQQQQQHLPLLLPRPPQPPPPTTLAAMPSCSSLITTTTTGSSQVATTTIPFPCSSPSCRPILPGSGVVAIHPKRQPRPHETNKEEKDDRHTITTTPRTTNQTNKGIHDDHGTKKQNSSQPLPSPATRTVTVASSQVQSLSSPSRSLPSLSSKPPLSYRLSSDCKSTCPSTKPSVTKSPFPYLSPKDCLTRTATTQSAPTNKTNEQDPKQADDDDDEGDSLRTLPSQCILDESENSNTDLLNDDERRLLHQHRNLLYTASRRSSSVDIIIGEQKSAPPAFFSTSPVVVPRNAAPAVTENDLVRINPNDRRSRGNVHEDPNSSAWSSLSTESLSASTSLHLPHKKRHSKAENSHLQIHRLKTPLTNQECNHHQGLYDWYRPGPYAEATKAEPNTTRRAFHSTLSQRQQQEKQVMISSERANLAYYYSAWFHSSFVQQIYPMHVSPYQENSLAAWHSAREANRAGGDHDSHGRSRHAPQEPQTHRSMPNTAVMASSTSCPGNNASQRRNKRHLPQEHPMIATIQTTRSNLFQASLPHAPNASLSWTGSDPSKGEHYPGPRGVSDPILDHLHPTQPGYHHPSTGHCGSSSIDDTRSRLRALITPSHEVEQASTALVYFSNDKIDEDSTVNATVEEENLNSRELQPFKKGDKNDNNDDNDDDDDLWAEDISPYPISWKPPALQESDPIVNPEIVKPAGARSRVSKLNNTTAQDTANMKSKSTTGRSTNQETEQRPLSNQEMMEYLQSWLGDTVSSVTGSTRSSTNKQQSRLRQDTPNFDTVTKPRADKRRRLSKEPDDSQSFQSFPPTRPSPLSRRTAATHDQVVALLRVNTPKDNRNGSEKKQKGSPQHLGHPDGLTSPPSSLSLSSLRQNTGPAEPKKAGWDISPLSFHRGGGEERRMGAGSTSKPTPKQLLQQPNQRRTSNNKTPASNK
ncbi:hypothetical protein ACA910_006758 [Epithemia clementina (nom. ined.)]